jgi:hypothetical protein
MLELLYQFIGLVIVLVGFTMLYVSAHVQEEQRKGKKIPLFWEKGSWLRKVKRKIFDKSDIKYRDGDNT